MQSPVLINPEPLVTPIQTREQSCYMLCYRAMNMTRINFFIFLCTAVEADIGKHVFIPEKKDWETARSYCRQHYTDLSMVYSQSDQDKLSEAAGGNYRKGWIGLYRDANDTWHWSIGGEVPYENWNSSQPNNDLNIQDTVFIHSSGKWNDFQRSEKLDFYCFSITVVEMRSTWEEALEHCRETYTDLPSLLSETDRHLGQREINKAQITDPVWIGLRFLSDRWMWTNNDSLVYEDWPEGDDHRCPERKRCGALTTDKMWVNLDCQDKLPFICI
ncbi:macrophage mannose receptor 1-like [Solea solea]|uniref:macrophage mannose receptor 1-like n=1 Tax=Solea solea TaxID=90069 RepID=UPI00272C0875|nr:macrophage mannose receptor 1-like [Solea solea]